MQLIHADQILTGALETIEEAGAQGAQDVWGPVQSVSAVVRGIQSGVEFSAAGAVRRKREPAETPDESLFIYSVCRLPYSLHRKRILASLGMTTNCLNRSTKPASLADDPAAA